MSRLTIASDKAAPQNDRGRRSPAGLAERPAVPTQVALRRRVGNAGWQQVLQAKLTVSHPDDAYEREADRVADTVLRMPDPAAGVDGVTPPALQRHCPDCREELQRRAPEEDELVAQTQPAHPADTIGRKAPPQEEELQRSGTAAEGPVTVSAQIESSIQALTGRGAPLSEPVRTFMEPRFRADFSGVRVHTDAQAHDLARAVNAQAFTVGRDVVFAAGHYAPESESGRHLLAHELTHVVQQGGGG